MQLFGAEERVQKAQKYSKYQLRAHNYIHNSALYRTNLLRRVGGYSAEFAIGFEDWELNLKLSKLTSRFANINEPLLKYRRHLGPSRDNEATQKMKTVSGEPAAP